MDVILGLDHRFPYELGSVMLVHGMPTLTVPPYVKYGHAWLEIGDTFCYDAERDMIVPKALFYAVGKINPVECHEYNAGTFRAKVNEFGYWGPWDGLEACGPIDESIDGISER